jgi:hypothetical protein
MNTSESSELVIHCIHSGRIPTVKGGWMATILNPYRSYRIKIQIQSYLIDVLQERFPKGQRWVQCDFP